MYRVRPTSSAPYCDCFVGVHSCSKRGQIQSSFTRSSNPSVSGRLAGESQRSRVLFSRCSKMAHTGKKIGGLSIAKKIIAQTNSGYRVSKLSLQPLRRSSISKSSENRQTTSFGSFHLQRSDYYSKDNHVFNWGHGFHGEDSFFRLNPYEAVSVFVEDQLAVFPVLGKSFSNFSVGKGPSGLVDGSSELAQGFKSASEGTQYVNVHRCIGEGLGAHLNNCNISGVWHNWHINILELKAVFLALALGESLGLHQTFYSLGS